MIYFILHVESVEIFDFGEPTDVAKLLLTCSNGARDELSGVHLLPVEFLARFLLFARCLPSQTVPSLQFIHGSGRFLCPRPFPTLMEPIRRCVHPPCLLIPLLPIRSVSMLQVLPRPQATVEADLLQVPGVGVGIRGRSCKACPFPRSECPEEGEKRQETTASSALS